ncbi:cyclic nucleotide-binding domain protein (macronuclear) [Tetrahymena thermophila SB210]|uniref:Cyclic nucleotide-binding domain protein n=1 Tax=Tetrahymena thermophila (strain SB210) TaxID=312017 RepID=W7X683_TETTS|nr:cyclic nucleotide-binding domain protein [Tetrahymena thermophila SB210]EWS72912.1 cyclic nucleotide-binding domain protein [Tetrahymena thermophila SB210]|eukprot:XP_012654552.1 cyclic nucleotide-binding domain protein [Tetrahymena thermophila SB210]
MDQQKQKLFDIKEQEVSEFSCKPDQGLLFLDNNSFIQQGGHKGDEDKIQESYSNYLKDKQIFLSEIVLNDTNQCQKFTEEDVFSSGDPRFYDLWPQNKKLFSDLTHDIIFKNCISNVTQQDVQTKNFNTPNKPNQGQQSIDIIIKPNKSSQNEKQGSNLSANGISDNQAEVQNCIENIVQQELDLYPESNNTQKIQKIDNPQQKINSTKLNIDSNFYQKKQQDSISFCKQQKSELSKISSLSQEQNNLYSTSIPNNNIIISSYFKD